MEELLFPSWNIHLNQFRMNSLSSHLTWCAGQRPSHGSEKFKLMICWVWEREITRDAASWLHFECPLSLWLLHGSILDYGSPLLCVITKASNSVWQLWPGLKTLNSYIFVYISARFISVKSYAISLSHIFQSCLHWCRSKPVLITFHLSVLVLLYLPLVAFTLLWFSETTSGFMFLFLSCLLRKWQRQR